MNKKGFAVSIILYSIIFLIISTLYILLSIEKNRNDVNKEYRDSIISELNANASAD